MRDRYDFVAGGRARTGAPGGVGDREGTDIGLGRHGPGSKGPGIPDVEALEARGHPASRRRAARGCDLQGSRPGRGAAAVGPHICSLAPSSRGELDTPHPAAGREDCRVHGRWGSCLRIQAWPLGSGSDEAASRATQLRERTATNLIRGPVMVAVSRLERRRCRPVVSVRQQPWLFCNGSPSRLPERVSIDRTDDRLVRYGAVPERRGRTKLVFDRGSKPGETAGRGAHH